MKSLQINSYHSTGLRQEFDVASVIEVDDDPFSEGAFGEVYVCHRIDGKRPLASQIIKIFKEQKQGDAAHNYQTIQRLQDKLRRKNEEMEKNGQDSLLNVYPGLKGVPQFSFEGTFEGKKVMGFSADNLKSLGFQEFKDILENQQLLSRYQKISIDQKLLIAYHFVSAFKLLMEFHYIHADVKPEAIFVNTNTSECAIIDFDSGVITERPEDEPNTWGAANDWVAPEIWDQIKNQTNVNQKIQVDLYTDVWSITIGVHYFLTTVHPLFFLKDLSPKVIRQYFSENRWPESKDSSYFKSEYRAIYKQYRDWLDRFLPAEIERKLSQSINYGYKDPIKRTSYSDWQKALKSVQRPPTFVNLSVDRPSIINGVESTIKWEVIDAHTVIISPIIGKVSSLGSITVQPDQNTVYNFKAIGLYGETTETLRISVFPTPVMKTLIVPTPDFSQLITFSSFRSEKPVIDVSIKLKLNPYPKKPDFSIPSPIEWSKLPLHKNKNTSFLALSKLYYEFKQKILNRFYPQA